MNIIEKDGKVYGAVSNGVRTDYDSSIEYKLTIYEFEFNTGEPGFTLHEITSISFPEHYATIAIDYIPQTDLWLLVQSSIISQGRQRYRVILCDDKDDFKIVSEQKLDTIGHPIPFQIDSDSSKTYILGSVLGPPQDEIFFLEYFHSDPDHLPAIQFKQSDPRRMFWITSMRVDHLTGHMLTFYYNGIAVLDSTLHQVKRFDHTSHIGTHDHGHILQAGNHYYSHGAKRFAWDVGFRNLVFQKYDTSFNILLADTFGISGQDNYPFIIKSIDHRNGELMVGGHLDGPFNHNFFAYVKKFYLAKHDEDMNQVWYKEYGGDKIYWFGGLHLLDDGGAFAYGFVTDSIDNHRYAYIMHIDANGEILSTSTIPPKPETTIRIINPGREALRILNPDDIDARIVLYDLHGREMWNREIDGTEAEFPADGIPAGVYPYTLMSEGKVIGAGKWVKAD